MITRAKLLLLAPLVLTAPRPAFGPPEASGLCFHPAEKSSHRRSFRERSTFEANSFVRSVNAHVLPAPLPALRGTRTRELEVVDTFAIVGPGRPERLRRAIALAEGRLELLAEHEDGREDHELGLESPLDGARVLFLWDEEEEGFARRLEAGAEEKTVELGGLREDLDLRALLPAREASEGESWELDAEALRALLAAGGDLGLRFEHEPDGPFDLLAPEELAAVSLISLAELAPSAEGVLRAAWKDRVERKGSELALVELELELEFRHELSQRLERMIEHSKLQSERFETRCTVELELRGRGRLAWDLTAGLFRELELELAGKGVLRLDWRRRVGRHELEEALEVGFALGSELEATCEPEPAGRSER